MQLQPQAQQQQGQQQEQQWQHVNGVSGSILGQKVGNDKHYTW